AGWDDELAQIDRRWSPRSAFREITAGLLDDLSDDEPEQLGAAVLGAIPAELKAATLAWAAAMVATTAGSRPGPPGDPDAGRKRLIGSALPPCDRARPVVLATPELASALLGVAGDDLVPSAQSEWASVWLLGAVDRDGFDARA